MSFLSTLRSRIYNIPLLLSEIAQTFITGQKILMSELKWLAVKQIRRSEIRQLEKLRQKEYARLGKRTYYSLVENNFSSQDSAIFLSKSQLDFLNQEIESLEKKLEDYRELLIKKRKNSIKTTIMTRS